MAFNNLSKFPCLNVKKGVSLSLSILDRILSEYFSLLRNLDRIDSLYASVINEVEKVLIDKVLKLTKFNKSRSARILGISRNTLNAKLKFLKLT